MKESSSISKKSRKLGKSVWASGDIRKPRYSEAFPWEARSGPVQRRTRPRSIVPLTATPLRGVVTHAVTRRVASRTRCFVNFMYTCNCTGPRMYRKMLTLPRLCLALSLLYCHATKKCCRDTSDFTVAVYNEFNDFGKLRLHLFYVQNMCYPIEILCEAKLHFSVLCV